MQILIRIFAFRNLFSALFPLVNGKLGPFAPKICHNNDMYADFFYARNPPHNQDL